MPEMSEIVGMGWLPDHPSMRDYSSETVAIEPKRRALVKESVKDMLIRVGVPEPSSTAPLPSAVDLRKWCSPIEYQATLSSCTAHAGVGMVEYFERRAFGKHIDASRLFLYKVTRNFMHQTGDTGAFLRKTMGALTLFGVPPEEYWPYNIADFDREPSAFCYAFAQNYQAISYYRLDPIGTSKEVLLDRIKRELAAGLPKMFGFTVYGSILQARATGKIPFPLFATPQDPYRDEEVLGGHAVMAVGYDDTIEIPNNGLQMAAPQFGGGQMGGGQMGGGINIGSINIGGFNIGGGQMGGGQMGGGQMGGGQMGGGQMGGGQMGGGQMGGGQMGGVNIGGGQMGGGQMGDGDALLLPIETKRGALRIRNSWGPGWGEKGYGWLPYDYVLQGLAVDWWSLLKSEWLDTRQFGPTARS